MIGAVLRLVRTDMRAARLSWLAVACTLFVSGTGAAYAMAFLIEGEEDAGELGGTMLGMAIIGIASAVASVSGLAVNERRRTCARWKLLGLPGPDVFVVVMLQVLVVAVVASVPGALLAVPVVTPAAEYMAQRGTPLGDPQVTGAVLAWSVVICVGAALLGVLGKVFAVSRVRPTAALRAAVVPVARPGVLATGLGLMMTAAVVAIASTEDLSENGSVIGVHVMGLLAVVPLTGWLMYPVLQWTRVLRFFGPAARVAADSVRVRSAFTSAQVVPWFLVGGMVVGIGSTMIVVVNAGGGEITGVDLLVPMFAPAVLPPLVAGIASTLVMAPRARQDTLVMHRAGAGRRHLSRIVGWESVAVVVSAGLLTLLYTVAGTAAANDALYGTVWPQDWWTDILWAPFAAILAVMWLLVASVTALVRR
ncbi:MAG: FtsX-like permease family protein [Mycobacteriaceae bacterium]|uniref:FtsX-like permease family protein n=1 Tax=Corynebacterium sp. TaxID=1720 RepID=UPI003F973A57